MEVRLLGPVEVHADTGQLPIRGPIQRAVARRHPVGEGGGDPHLRGLPRWPLDGWRMALLDENGPDELLRQVRAAEATDPVGRQRPRTKRGDDATAVYLVLS
jgi:hypothetical protein